jgi:hypothetical protein
LEFITGWARALTDNVGMSRHHFVSQFYLGGFTGTGKKDGWFWVYNRAVCGRSTPKNVAYTLDFNELTTGDDSEALEKALSGFESKVATVVHEIRRSHQIPPDADFSYVLNLIALFWTRNPRFREAQLSSKRHGRRIIDDMLTSGRSFYESHFHSAKAAGHIHPDAECSFEKFRDARRNHQDEFPPDVTFATEFKTFPKILDIVCARSWTLLVAPRNADFVCCDHPVSVVPKGERSGSFLGMATQDTACYFPLESGLALVGVFENPESPVVDVSAERVAEINSFTMNSAACQVFSKDSSVKILHDGRILKWSWPDGTASAIE